MDENKFLRLRFRISCCGNSERDVEEYGEKLHRFNDELEEAIRDQGYGSERIFRLIGQGFKGEKGKDLLMGKIYTKVVDNRKNIAYIHSECEFPFNNDHCTDFYISYAGNKTERKVFESILEKLMNQFPRFVDYWN